MLFVEAVHVCRSKLSTAEDIKGKQGWKRHQLNKLGLVKQIVDEREGGDLHPRRLNSYLISMSM